MGEDRVNTSTNTEDGNRRGDHITINNTGDKRGKGEHINKH